MAKAKAVQIELADLDNPVHARGIVTCLDTYARDAMGGGQGLDETTRDAIIPGLRQHGANTTLLALLAEEIVGIAVCMISYSTFRAQLRLNLHDLAVNPAHRGYGVGRKLLEAVAEHARSIGCCAVTLEVREDNARAQALYRSLGFEAGHSPMAFWVKPL